MFGFGQNGSVGTGVIGGGGGGGEPASQRQELPLLQTPVKSDGHCSWQLLPQAPQLYGSVFRLTQRLSHCVVRPPWFPQSMQTPASQKAESPQELPQAPQLFGSFIRS